MKVMIRKASEQYTIYVAKKDLEESIVEMEKPGLWGGWVKVANGWTLDLPEMPDDTRLPITVEAYPYDTGSTVIAAAFFSDPEFESRNDTRYQQIQLVTSGRRIQDREDLLTAQSEDPSQLVLWHVLDTENNPRHRDMLDLSVLYPGGAIAWDAMPWSMPDGLTYTGDAWPLPEEATSHPRSSGTFTHQCGRMAMSFCRISSASARSDRRTRGLCCTCQVSSVHGWALAGTSIAGR